MTSRPAPTELPTLPVVVARLVALYTAEDFSAEDVTETLEADPPLAARVLRLANSAYYGFAGRVDTLQRATVLLGAATVQAVALGATVLGAWTESSPPIQVEGLWIHSYLCGKGCRFLGHRLPTRDHRSTADGLFLAGLLHDVGKFLFLSREPQQYPRDLEESGSALRALEEQRFGHDYAQAGGDLLEAWGLPFPLVSVVRFHHRDGLRAELRPDWEVLLAVREALRPEAERTPGPPPALIEDLVGHLERARPEAEAFYRAIQ